MTDHRKELFEILKKAGALEAFRDMAEGWVRATANEMVGACDDNHLHALRGQMRICIELADGASAALAGDGPSANGPIPDGILETLG